MGNFFQDVRYSLRRLRKRPGFAFLTIVTLALGVGANVAIFSIINSLLLRPYPHIDADHWVYVWEKPLQAGGPMLLSASPPNIHDWKVQSQSFDLIAPFFLLTYNLSSDGYPEQTLGSIISPEIFSAIGTAPALGRLLIPADSKDSNQAVVISYGLWQRRFGGDAKVLGQEVILNSVPYTIVGVTPKGFSFPPEFPIDIWTAMPDAMLQSNDRSQRGLQVAAKLKPGVDLRAAQSEMNLIANRLASQYPQDKDFGVTLISLRQAMAGNFSTPLLILSLALVFVLLLACLNIANLQLAHLEARRREIALRAALGAGTRALLRQLLTEAMLPIVFAGGLGVLLAPLGTSSILSSIPSTAAPNLNVKMDSRVLLVSFGVVLITSVISALLPALRVSHVDLASNLVSTGGASTSIGGISRRMRQVFMVAQIALALILMIGAGLLVQSLLKLQRVNPGFDANDRLSLSFSAPKGKYRDGQAISELAQHILDETRSLPGIQDAGLIQALPFAPTISWSQAISRQEPKGIANLEELPLVRYTVVSPRYFEAMGITVKAGRSFADSDNHDSPPAIIIDESVARMYFAGEDPVGKQLWSGHAASLPGSAPRTIVGVAQNVLMNGLDGPSQPEVYVPILQQEAAPNIWRNLFLVVHFSSDQSNLVNSIRTRIGKVDSELAIANVSTMRELLQQSLWRQRLTGNLLTLLSVMAVAIAMIGVFGITRYLVSQRTREIALRIALGARSQDIFRLVLAEEAVIILVGIALGILGAVVLTRFLASLLFGVTQTDPSTITALSLLLAVLVILAGYSPARRASKIDPLVMLKYE